MTFGFVGVNLAMQRETTLGRAGLALLAGAACGSVLIGLLTVVPRIVRAVSATGGFNESWLDIATIAAFISGLYAGAYACGLLLLAVPAWLLLHKFGRRRGVDALMLGIVLSTIIYIVVAEWFVRFQGKLVYGPAPFSWILRSGLASWSTAIEGAVWIAIVSGVTGLVIWRIAYRRCQSS